MSAEQNKTAMRRYFEELWNKGNLAVIDEIVAPGMSLNEEKNTSLEKWRQALSAWLTAFPDFEYHVDLLIADGDIVAAKTHFTATHQGVYDFGGWGPWPPTGNSLDIKEFIFFRLAEARSSKCGTPGTTRRSRINSVDSHQFLPPPLDAGGGRPSSTGRHQREHVEPRVST